MATKKQRFSGDSCLDDPNLHDYIFHYLNSNALMTWRMTCRSARDAGTKRLNEICLRSRTNRQIGTWAHWPNHGGTATSAYAVCKRICVICKKRNQTGLNQLGVPAHWGCMMPFMQKQHTFRSEVNVNHMAQIIGHTYSHTYSLWCWVDPHHCIPFEKTVQYYLENHQDAIEAYQQGLIDAKARQVVQSKVRAQEVRQEWAAVRQRFKEEFGCTWVEAKKIYPAFLLRTLRSDSTAFHRTKLWLVTHELIPEPLWSRVFESWRFNETLSAVLDAPASMLDDLVRTPGSIPYFNASDIVRWRVMYDPERHFSFQARVNIFRMWLSPPPELYPQYLDVVETVPDECLEVLYGNMPTYVEQLQLAVTLWPLLPRDPQILKMFKTSHARPALLRLLQWKRDVPISTLTEVGQCTMYARSYIQASTICDVDPFEVFGRTSMYIPSHLSDLAGDVLKEWLTIQSKLRGTYVSPAAQVE